VIASLILSALIAQAATPEATSGCAERPLQIALPSGVAAPTMPFGAPVPPAKAVISVVVAQDGHLVTETIFGGSGYASLDLAAYSIIQRSRFTPKMMNCQTVTAYQLYVVDFSQTPPSVTATSLPTP
jgi:hypothetical protein